MIKEFPATLPSQPRPHPTAPWLKSRKRSEIPPQLPICPILPEGISNASTSSNRPEIGISGSPKARAIDWAFTRRCAATGSQVMSI